MQADQSRKPLQRRFWISLGAVTLLFFCHFAQVGLWAGFLVLLGALQTADVAGCR